MKSSHTHLCVKWSVHTSKVPNVPDDLNCKTLSCAVQSIIEEEEDAEEIKGILNAVLVFDQISLDVRTS